MAQKSSVLPFTFIISINFSLFLSSENLLGLPLFFLTLPFYLYLLKFNQLSNKIYFTKYSVTVTILFLIIYLISLLNNVNSLFTLDLKYYLWPFLALINIIPLSSLFISIHKKQKLNKLSGLFFFLLFILFFIYSIYNNDVRLSFGFGPNMLYRIILFNFFLFIFFIKQRKLIYFLMPIILFLIYRIGSRGGVMVLFGLLLFSIIFFSNKRLKKNLIITSLIITTIFNEYILYFFESIYDSVRVFRINLDSRSIFYEDFYSWILNASSNELYFGSGFRSYPYEWVYPHNLFLESIHGYGFIFSLLLIILIVFHITLSDKKMIMLSIPFFIGAMLSGSLYDNFIVISFLFFSLLKFRLNTFSDLKTKTLL